jgi:hypothetical protein
MEGWENILIFSKKQKALEKLRICLAALPPPSHVKSGLTLQRKRIFRSPCRQKVLSSPKEMQKLLEAPERRELVRTLFLYQHWSPEEIANRLKFENNSSQKRPEKLAKAAAFRIL